MRLVIFCKSCGHKNKVNFSFEDRLEIKKRYGNQVCISCKNCGNRQGYLINEIKAEINGVLNLILLILMFLFIVIAFAYFSEYLFIKGTIQSIYIIPIAIAIPPLIYFNWLGNERKRINEFNRFRL